MDEILYDCSIMWTVVFLVVFALLVGWLVHYDPVKQKRETDEHGRTL